MESNNKCRVNNKHPSCPKTLSNEGCLTTCSNNHNICCYHRKSVGAYRIRPPWWRTRPLNDGVLIVAIVFIFAHVKGVCDTPLRFSYDAETNGFSHHGLRNCFTIKDELANGEHLYTGRYWLFRDWEPSFETRAKSTCNLRNEDYSLRKVAIATAKMKLFTAQRVSQVRK